MKTAQKLLSGTPLRAEDAARLVLETLERMGDGAGGGTRLEVMHRLRHVLELGVAAAEAEERTVSFAEAAWASVEARADRRPTTRRDLRYYVRRILKHSTLGQRPLRAITRKECLEALRAGFGHTAHGCRKARSILHSIFAYGMQQEWCASNPVSLIPAPRVQEREIPVLTLEEVHRLVETASQPEHRDMLPSVGLMLYCGVRPAEVARLRPEDIQLSNSTVYIRPAASKTGGGRQVPLRRCKELLRRMPCPVWIPRNWLRRWRRLRRAAGGGRWRPDILRHSFASYHAARFRNLPELQLEMGHRDSSLLRTRYVNMRGVSARDAKLFWAGGA